jgi:PRTRC genetic system protein B
MSKRNGKITVPAGVKPKGAIFLLDSEFLLVTERAGAMTHKYVSPGALRQAFAAEPIDTGWIPAGVRRWGVGGKGTYMLRWHAPAVYPVWLPGRRRQSKVPMPGLAFFAQGNSYYVWATKGNKFDPKARLFNAPCANVNELGLICWGENAHPDVATGCFDRMWSTFWEAPFSPNWATGKSRKFTNANQRLADLARSRATTYPEDDLTPLQHRLIPGQTTLEAVVEMMARRGESSWD